MAATTTLAELLVSTAEDLDLGLVIEAGTGSTTTITETDTGVSELRGPFSGAKIPIGSPVSVLVGGTVGEDTYVSGWVPSTGVVSLSPAITTGATEFVIWDAVVKHAKNVEKAISRANKKCRQPRMTPLTFVPDGDLQGVTVGDYWTAAANGTAAYATAQIYPAGSAADEFGAVGVSRVLQLTSTGATSVTGNGIRAQHSAQQKSWYFQTAIRLVSGAGTATFSIIDNTNSAAITLNVTRGNDSNTLTTTTFGDFMVCEGTFQQPATCDEVAPRLTLSATTMVAQMTPLIMFPLDAVSYPLPNRLSSQDIGNFHYATTLSSPGGLPSIAFSPPITIGGLTHTLNLYGDHNTVTFNFIPSGPVYFDEIAYGAALTAMTDTTTMPASQVKLWARAELYDFIMRSESRQQKTLPNGLPAPSNWRSLRNAAYRSAKYSQYEPELQTILGRR